MEYLIVDVHRVALCDHLLSDTFIVPSQTVSICISCRSIAEMSG